MRSLPYFVSAGLVVLVGTVAVAQQVLVPEPRRDVPADRCLVELTLPNDATVKIDGRDYGKQRKIMLPTPAPPSNPNAWNLPGFNVVVDFSNGGRLSEFVVAKGGAATRIALSKPPLEIVLLKGPQDEITSLAFSPDGKWIAMATNAEQAILWETGTGLIRWDGDVPFSNASSDSVSVAFSPDGRQLLVGAEAAGVAILDVAHGKRVRDVAGDACEPPNDVGANAVAFAPDGRRILAALSWTSQPMIAIWDVRNGKRVRTVLGPKEVEDQTDRAFRNIAVTPDGRQVIAATWEDHATLFGLETGKALRKFQSTAGDIHSLTISHDGKSLLAGTEGTKAILWNISSGKLLRTFSCSDKEYTGTVESVAFSPDDRKVLAGAAKQAFLFDIGSGARLRTFDSSDGSTYAVAFSPDGRHVLTAGRRDWQSNREIPLDEAVLWDIATGRKLRTYPTPKDAVQSLAFDVDGRRLTVSYEGDRAMTWDMDTGKPTDSSSQAVKKREETSRADSEEETPFSPRNRSAATPDEYRSTDGRWTVRAGKHNTVLLKDQQTSKEIKILDYGMMPTIRAAFSTKTSRIAVADNDSVHIFNPVTGRRLATLYSAYGGRDWLVTTPTGFCAGSPGGLSLVRVRVGEAEYSLERYQTQLNSPGMVARILRDKPRE
jgi:WD40 repeat protein